MSTNSRRRRRKRKKDEPRLSGATTWSKTRSGNWEKVRKVVLSKNEVPKPPKNLKGCLPPASLPFTGSYDPVAEILSGASSPRGRARREKVRPTSKRSHILF